MGNRNQIVFPLDSAESIFARHGILEVLMSDLGQQLSGQAFTSFTALYGFRHLKGSLRFFCKVMGKRSEQSRPRKKPPEKGRTWTLPGCPRPVEATPLRGWLKLGSAPRGPASSYHGDNSSLPDSIAFVWKDKGERGVTVPKLRHNRLHETEGLQRRNSP